MLAGVKINFSTWSSHHLSPEKDEEFYRILSQLDNSVAELRHVARNLMPESLLNFGLETALNDLCEFYIRKILILIFNRSILKKNYRLISNLIYTELYRNS
jgi:signal transduction histidine kinase